MRKKKNAVEQTSYKLPPEFERHMASLGITSETIDRIDREEEERERLALKRWNRLVKEIMADAPKESMPEPASSTEK